VILLVLYGGYMLWFRNLSLFAIHDVTIKGATTSEQQIKAAVEQVTGDMTTLHIKDDELRDAVARFPTVASVGASTSFPHGLEVTITERLPVAYVRVAGHSTAVSADGYLLTGASFDEKQLPRIMGAAPQGVRLDEDAAMSIHRSDTDDMRIRRRRPVCCARTCSEVLRDGDRGRGRPAHRGPDAVLLRLPRGD